MIRFAGESFGLGYLSNQIRPCENLIQGLRAHRRDVEDEGGEYLYNPGGKSHKAIIFREKGGGEVKKKVEYKKRSPEYQNLANFSSTACSRETPDIPVPLGVWLAAGGENPSLPRP